MEDFNSDFDRLNAVTQQHAPQDHQHRPSPVTIATVGTLAHLAARSYNRQQEQVQGLRPRGWKYPVWGRYAAAALLLHFGIFLIWYANTYTADDYFWIMVLMTGLLTWIPLMLLALAHSGRIEKHNNALLARQS